MAKIFAIPTTAETVEPAILVGETTDTTRVNIFSMLATAGYDIIFQDRGGNIDLYDAEDGPGIYGYEPDGQGAIGVTVRAEG